MRHRRPDALLACLVIAACSGPPEELPPDARIDAGRPDARAADAALPDAALPVPDAAPPDAAPIDAGPPDATPPDADTRNPHAIHFTDVTMAATGGYYLGGRTTVDNWGVGSGAAAGDVDGDGDVDLILARNDDPGTPRPGGPTLVLENVSAPGSIAFVESTGLYLEDARAHGAALGDFDRDGDLDAFIAAEGRDYLMENDGGGNFVDVTVAAGVMGRLDDVSVGAVFADLNHDGLLDLYVYNHTAATPPWPDLRAANRLHLGAGDGTFVDVSEASGADDDGSSQAAAVFDLDGTGDPVIYVVNDRFYIDEAPAYGTPELLPGDGWYQLQEITAEGVPVFANLGMARGVFAGRSGMGVAFADVDADLTPDVYVADWGRNDLYLNETPGIGALTYGTHVYDVDVHRDADGYNQLSWGMRFLDLDRDGLDELFVVNGGVTEALACSHYHQIDWLLRQPDVAAPFVVITETAGFPLLIPCFSMDHAVGGRGAVAGDFDGDGDDDLVVTPYVEPYRFYLNDTPFLLHEVAARLVGSVSAIDPVGATLTVTRSDGRVIPRYRYGGGDTFSQSDGVLRVGLGGTATVASATVRWPSGLEQDVTALLAVDAVVTIVEPAWLSVEPRTASAADPAPVFTYAPVDATGAPLGVAAAGRAVVVTRSDGVVVTVTDHGDGTYSAPLPHPGASRRTVLSITVDGVPLKPRPMISYR